MNNIRLKNLAVISVAFMLFSVGVAFFAKSISRDVNSAIAEEAIAGEGKHTEEVEEYTEDYVEEYTQEYEKELIGEMFGEEQGLIGYLSMPKYDEKSTYSFEDDYINRQILLTISNLETGKFKKNAITFFSNADIDEMDNENVSAIIEEVNVKHINNKKKTVISFQLNGVYDYKISETEDNYFIGLYDLKSVYDKIIVVDAGHGGGDNGCGSRDSICYEKMITLAVVKELKEKLDGTDIKVYYTRLKDETVYLRPRVTLANDVQADMFISIHCNYYDRYWLYDVDGAETLYSSVRKSVKSANKRLAEIMLNNLTKETTLSKRSVIDRGTSLYILKKSKVPSTIVEMGYMSDREDLKYLLNEKKRKKIVLGLYNGIVETYKKMYGKTVEETESKK